MAELAAHRDLLFALIALQNGLVDQSQLVAAFQAWTVVKSIPLADHLAGMGYIDAEGRRAIEALTALHVKRHGGSTERSLAAIRAGRSTRECLAAIDDPDVEVTLSLVGTNPDSTPNGDTDFTTNYSVGEATADGQRFRVLRPHAQGGLGAVYVALDSELNREVALKRILDPHADDPTSRQRFLLEAQVTGGLEHPGIVPVYGLGAYGDGRPFYAMRFIKGSSLKQAIEQFHASGDLRNDPGRRSLELRNLLRRFTDICNAIGYAHSRGVLHRDIKPGNVIVGKHGETLVVDWGLAKPIGHAEPNGALPERTFVPLAASGTAETMAGSALGTPAYMSPEQAAGDINCLGPRSDVYSLGATLYCLLTGRPPFAGDMGDVLSAVRDGRFAAPRAVDRTIDPALEAVCQKAMAKLPEHRYASCRALADDVDRWMADEPVSARREPLADQVRRWMRRRRTFVTAAAVATAVALAGLAVVLAVQSRANRKLLAVNGRLNVAVARETRAREQSDRRFALAREAIEAFYTGASEDVLLKEPQLEGLRNKLLGSSLDFYKKLQRVLDAEPGGEHRDELAGAFERVSEITDRIGSQPAAIEAAQRALEIRVQLAREHPDLAGAQSSLATVQYRFGVLLSETGQSERALQMLQRARVTEETLAQTRPAVIRFQADLAKIHVALGNLLGFRLGRTADAVREHRRATEILESQQKREPTPECQNLLVAAYQNLGSTYAVAGSPAEALSAYDRCLAVGEDLCRAHPDVAVFRSDLAKAHNDAGTPFAVNGQPARGLESFRRSLALYEQLTREHPTHSRYRSGLATAHQSIGWLLEHEGHVVDALKEYELALPIHERLAADNPTVTQHRAAVALLHANISDQLRATGRLTEALPRIQRALAMYERLVGDNPRVPYYRSGMVTAHVMLAALFNEMKKPAEARQEYARAAAIYENLPNQSPMDLYNVACVQARLGDLTPSRGDRDQAARRVANSHYDRAMIALRKAIIAGHHQRRLYRHDTDLDPLRSRADFQLLMLDEAFPANPFAK